MCGANGKRLKDQNILFIVDHHSHDWHEMSGIWISYLLLFLQKGEEPIQNGHQVQIWTSVYEWYQPDYIVVPSLSHLLPPLHSREILLQPGVFFFLLLFPFSIRVCSFTLIKWLYSVTLPPPCTIIINMTHCWILQKLISPNVSPGFFHLSIVNHISMKQYCVCFNGI